LNTVVRILRSLAVTKKRFQAFNADDLFHVNAADFSLQR